MWLNVDPANSLPDRSALPALVSRLSAMSHKVTLGREPADVVVEGVVLADHQSAAVGGGDVVREVEGVAARRLVDHAQLLRLGS